MSERVSEPVGVHPVDTRGRSTPVQHLRDTGAGHASLVTYSHPYSTLPADLAAVCKTATVRLSNPTAMQAFTIVGDFSKTFGVASEFFGFTVAEQVVLDRYRRRTLP